MDGCSIDGCNRPRHCRGWCKPHYSRWQRHGDPTAGRRAPGHAEMCRIDGCERRARSTSTGLCGMHQKRLVRTGSPDGAAQAERGSLVAWLRVAALAATDDCIPWPFASTQHGGYGLAYWDGRKIGAHQLVLILAGHDRPSDEHEVLHSCDNPPCCNPRHLSWGSRGQNLQDAWDRGRR